MDKVKLALIGVSLILGVYSVATISSLNSKIEEMEKFQTNSRVEMLDKISKIKHAPSATSNVKSNTQQPAKPEMPNTVQTKPIGPTTSIAFTEEIHEFGEVEVDSENLYAFEFTNTGTAPLIITNAKGSCGCTVPQWPKEPILPGKSGMIDVKYTPNKGQAGQLIEKVVTVTANTEPANTMVRIKANVKAN